MHLVTDKSYEQGVGCMQVRIQDFQIGGGGGGAKDYVHTVHITSTKSLRAGVQGTSKGLELEPILKHSDIYKTSYTNTWPIFFFFPPLFFFFWGGGVPVVPLPGSATGYVLSVMTDLRRQSGLLLGHPGQSNRCDPLCGRGLRDIAPSGTQSKEAET